ncbi:8532_t:CDS:2, partial [Gigaspora rosea]
CSDSRVSPELITHSDGEIFVLRNVANQFKLKDLGSLSALEYAVNKLNVRHIFVCGHYGCGGVNHIIDSVYYADSSKEYTPRTHIDKWLSKFIDDVYVPNRSDFSKIFDDILKDYKDSTVDERRDIEFHITVRVPTIGELLHGKNITEPEQEAIIYQQCSKMEMDRANRDFKVKTWLSSDGGREMIRSADADDAKG